MGHDHCPCPYVPCAVHGNCAACIGKSRAAGDLVHCMEEIAQRLGAVLPERHPKTLVCASYEEMSKTCAQLIQQTLAAKPDALLCLPAGQSAVRTFELLCEMQKLGHLDATRARFVQLDEWLDLPDDRENCAHFMRKTLYAPLGIAPEKIHSFDVHAPDLAAECRHMDDYILREGPIDLMLLGLGMNGHVGLNEPGLSWDNGAVVVDLDETTKQVGQKYFAAGMALTRGITLGMRHVFGAKMVLLQVGERKKAEIVRRVFATAPTINLPGTVVKLHPNALVVLDKDAASEIDTALCCAEGPEGWERLDQD